MTKPGYLPGLTPAESLRADLEEIVSDEDLDFEERKARRFITREDETRGEWEEVWSAREVLPIINRLRRAETAVHGGR
jgi:hypothetical protein